MARNEEPEEIEEEELEDEDEDDDLADLSDDELREQLRATRAAVKKANDQSARRRQREKRERLERERAAAAKPKPKGDGDETVDVAAIREEALKEGAAPAILRAKKAEAKSALLAAGVASDRLTYAIRNLDLDDLELDDDGLDGIDDAVLDLKRALPELFAKPRKPRSSTAGANDRNGDGDGRKGEKSASQKAADQLLGAK